MSAENKLPRKVDSNKVKDPFEELARFLVKIGKGSEYEKYSLDEVRRAIKKLAYGQSALKTMDGAAHNFRAAFSNRFVNIM
jgi:hypothetical protein